MNRIHSLALAAAVSASVIVSTAVPAVAEQGMQKPFAKPATSRHHDSYAGRRAIARAYPATRVAAIPADAACSWCGREFVLILGIGF